MALVTARADRRAPGADERQPDPENRISDRLADRPDRRQRDNVSGVEAADRGRLAIDDYPLLLWTQQDVLYAVDQTHRALLERGNGCGRETLRCVKRRKGGKGEKAEGRKTRNLRRGPRLAISYRLSAIGYRLSAIGYHP